MKQSEKIEQILENVVDRMLEFTGRVEDSPDQFVDPEMLEQLVNSSMTLSMLHRRALEYEYWKEEERKQKFVAGGTPSGGPILPN